ncbi:O-spanin component [Yersinia phage vB_YenM_P778]
MSSQASTNGRVTMFRRMKRLSVKSCSLYFILSVSLLSMSACSTNKPTPTKPVVQANLLQKEETDGQKLKQLTGTDGLALTSTMEYYRDKYMECAVSKNGLIDVLLQQYND